ncbi:GIY-YIG nuclease family protein [Pelagovum pacificum]|uniref:Uncharacterized protein n=1 Tax=Pelagovum pacificum TaxID=2588711 RepID=A0A5C5GET9_9RHOB|nr:GIY-YIG nuclease family protein [Pelagovum pacificum]QQA44313.1 hypothetical protein I8N54_06985 [Pelagovum pacificum]TNY32567.1 hypothetical protein FHY64_04585 [Pelagovum pacificum]
MNRRYYWTKTWGAPDIPEYDALALSHEGTRQRILGYIQPGDIIVYLTSDAKESDPMLRGRLAGAVEIADPVLEVDVEFLRPNEKRPPEHYRDGDGRFRWPYGIAVSRTWVFIEQESNDTLIPDHADKRMQGAASIHEMRPEEIGRLMSLDVREQVKGGATAKLPFQGSLHRPWRQQAGMRKAANVNPGTHLYIAQIYDAHGLTFKVGSGKVADRVDELNRYRRLTQGEAKWSERSSSQFATVAGARAAEDFILFEAKKAGYGSDDHSEFLVGISSRDLNALYAKSIEIGLAVDAEETIV